MLGSSPAIPSSQYPRREIRSTRLRSGVHCHSAFVEAPLTSFRVVLKAIPEAVSLPLRDLLVQRESRSSQQAAFCRDDVTGLLRNAAERTQCADLNLLGTRYSFCRSTMPSRIYSEWAGTY